MTSSPARHPGPASRLAGPAGGHAPDGRVALALPDAVGLGLAGCVEIARPMAGRALAPGADTGMTGGADHGQDGMPEGREIDLGRVGDGYPGHAALSRAASAACVPGCSPCR